MQVPRHPAKDPMHATPIDMSTSQHGKQNFIMRKPTMIQRQRYVPTVSTQSNTCAMSETKAIAILDIKTLSR